MKTRLPEGARFTCQSCGQCCQGWAVPVERETVNRLRAHDWGDEPFEKGTTGDEAYQIRLVNNRCFFLDEQNRCRIHTELSYDAKPIVCRAFPLAVLDVGGTQYARLSYWCPTVVANTGKPLEHQARWLGETARNLDRRSAPLALNDQVALAANDFERLHQAIRRLLKDRTYAVDVRLAAAAALLHRLEQGSARLEGAGFERAVREAETAGTAALASETRGHGHSSAGRRVLSLYLLNDRLPGRGALLSRMAALFAYNLGLVSLNSRSVAATASVRQLRGVEFQPSAEGDELLTRYLCSKLDSRRYVAGDATMIRGFNLLVVAFGMIHLLARTKAAASARQTCSDDDLRAAVRAADLLVVEHSELNRGRLHARLTASLLGDRELAADIFASLVR